ncbi:hypothetical protein RhiirA1_404585 [Rhizophagus irregularis]|uniref:Uncharacterized protein n=1 Tax=Rhizophagus irregularis TaxID=588596 RepID=A0A2N0QPN5_9GLOM|nr:hypothetical protein RhiirA1_404585 [Rhizophagus irregularis]
MPLNAQNDVLNTDLNLGEYKDKSKDDSDLQEQNCIVDKANRENTNKTIHKVFPDRFSHQGQTKKEKILICSLKQKSDELEKFCNNEENIVCGIKLEEKGKIINPKFTQTFMVMHEKDKSALYNANHNIKQLKTKVAVFQNERSNLDNKTDLINQKSEKIKKSVDDILDEKN